MKTIVVKLAGITFSISLLYQENIRRFRDFISSEHPEFNIYISPSRLEEERFAIHSMYPNDVYEDYEIEFNALYRDIPVELFKRNILLFHGVLLKKDDTGFLFSASSGVGKSTHALNWKKRYGDTAVIINGDKPLLKLQHDGLYGYGSPWKGKENIGINDCVRIKSICYLSRGSSNIINKLDYPNEAMELFLDAVMLNQRENNMLEIIRWYKNTSSVVSFFKLECTNSPLSAEVSFHAMK